MTDRLLTPKEIDDCYPEWSQDENMTLFQLITKKQDAKSVKLERQAIGEFLKKRENAYTTGGWKPVVFGDEIEALLRGERPE